MILQIINIYLYTKSKYCPLPFCIYSLSLNKKAMKAINKAYVIKKSIAKLNFLGYCGSCIQNAKEKTLFYNNINDIEINLRQILSNKSMMQCNDKRKISILKRKAKLKLDYMLFYGSQLPMGKERNKFIQYFGEVNEIIDTITKIKIK